MPVLTIIVRACVLPCQATVRWLLRITSIQRPEVLPALVGVAELLLRSGMLSRCPLYTQEFHFSPLARASELVVVPGA